MKISQSRQKRFGDNKRRPLEFKEGEHVLKGDSDRRHWTSRKDEQNESLFP